MKEDETREELQEVNTGTPQIRASNTSSTINLHVLNLYGISNDVPLPRSRLDPQSNSLDPQTNPTSLIGPRRSFRAEMRCSVRDPNSR